MSGGPLLALGVDGGNSKTEVAVADLQGHVVARVRGGPSSVHPARGGLDSDELVRLVRHATGVATGPVAEYGAFCVTGADFPSDERRLARGIAALGLVRRPLVRNDVFAPLRCASDDGVGVGLVCGTGMNCVAVGPQGRTVRYPALGELSGDWGGGLSMGVAALAAAVRGVDGRDRTTQLSTMVPAHFGVARPIDVVRAVHEARIPWARLAELAPSVLGAAASGDVVAQGIVDRAVREAVAMVSSAARRVRFGGRPFPVVLAGGLFHDPVFEARVRDGITEGSPNATVSQAVVPPVVGALLLALDMAPVTPDVLSRVRREFPGHR